MLTFYTDSVAQVCSAPVRVVQHHFVLTHVFSSMTSGSELEDKKSARIPICDPKGSWPIGQVTDSWATKKPHNLTNCGQMSLFKYQLDFCCMLISPLALIRQDLIWIDFAINNQQFTIWLHKKTANTKRFKGCFASATLQMLGSAGLKWD